MRWFGLGILAMVSTVGWLYSQSAATQGLVAALSGMHEFAIESYTRAITSGHMSPEYLAVVYRFRGNSYAVLGDRKHATKDYAVAIRLDPNDAESYYGRGKLYHEAGRHEYAVADYSAAIQINPEYGVAFLGRGLSYWELGQAVRALQDYEKARELMPNNPVIKQKLAAGGPR
jgi:tetratricopeptide (TPR) repeat protein